MTEERQENKKTLPEANPGDWNEIPAGYRQSHRLAPESYYSVY